MPKTQEGGLIPLSTGGFRGSPSSFFFNFGRFYVRFNVFFMQSFWSKSFARKDISCHARNRMLDKIVFSHDFLLFSTACFFDIISPMSPQVLESTFSTDPWWSIKELCFRKDIHLVFSITRRTPVKDAGFI